ncbi:hypothetical protein B296_00045932 [Ensete ventricosum]|uniref:Uncharacterized protein n=1 Tax=Ensete ventricosum TaxID=4639 RepID=A0A426Z5S8_ENSVE|nr:hypothetical protein B296_00045932 [Ensete ventricosum]
MTIGRSAVHRPPPSTPHRPPLGYLVAKRNPYHCWWGVRVPRRMSTARCLSKKGSYSRRQRRRGCRQGGDGHGQSISDEHDDEEVKEEGELSTEEVAIVARRVQQLPDRSRKQRMASPAREAVVVEDQSEEGLSLLVCSKLLRLGDLRYIREAGQSAFFVADDELASAPKPRGTRTRGLRRRSPRHTAVPVEVMFVTAVARSATVILPDCLVNGEAKGKEEEEEEEPKTYIDVNARSNDAHRRPTRRPTREEECKNDLASGTLHIDRCELRASSK